MSCYYDYLIKACVCVEKTEVIDVSYLTDLILGQFYV